MKKPFERTYSTHKQNNSYEIWIIVRKRIHCAGSKYEKHMNNRDLLLGKAVGGRPPNLGEEMKNVADKMRLLRQQSASRERPLSAHRLKLISNKVSKCSMRVTEKRSLKMPINTRGPPLMNI